MSLYDTAADAQAVVLVPLRDDGWAVLYPDD